MHRRVVSEEIPLSMFAVFSFQSLTLLHAESAISPFVAPSLTSCFIPLTFLHRIRFAEKADVNDVCPVCHGLNQLLDDRQSTYQVD